MTLPSWLRWPPNCCETCTGWQRDTTQQWVGKCNQATALIVGEITDARYRCPAFVRKPDLTAQPAASS